MKINVFAVCFAALVFFLLKSEWNAIVRAERIEQLILETCECSKL